MRICFDTETPTRYYADGIPDLVCLTWTAESDKSIGHIAIGGEAIDLWESWLADPSIELIAHNAPFDCCVLAKASARRSGEYTRPGIGPAFEQVFRLYESGRLRDTIPCQRLIDIAQGRPGDDTRMGTLAKRLLHLDMSDDKAMPSEWKHLLGSSVIDWPTEARDATPWRFKYELLEGIPLESWPDEPRRYACEDPIVTWGIVDWQDKRAAKVFRGPIPNLAEQTRAALDLHMISLTGFATDRARVQRIASLYRTVETVCADLLVGNCALCGGPLPPMPEPKDYKAACADGALPGDARLGDCPACRERVALIREDVKFRGGRVYRGKHEPEQRRRVKDRKAAQRLVWATLGSQAPQTKTAKARGLPRGQDTVQTDADTLVKVAAVLADGREGLLREPDTLAHAAAGTLRDAILATPLPTINAIRLHSRAQKYLSAFLAPLDTDRRVRTSYQVCKDTGRTSARTPNVQNFPRPAEGLPVELTIRSCIVADPGDVFLVCDYAQIELVGFAHVLNVLGRAKGRGSDYMSSLAIAINSGMDGHIKVAAGVLHSTYAETLAAHKSAKAKHGIGLTEFERAVVRWRQVGKIENYGAAGGMGAVTFVSHAAKQDAVISLAESHACRDAWLKAWSPDVPDYFRYFGDLTNANGYADITQLYSGRIRGKATFTQCCNTMFQGLCADGAKHAMRLIVDACYRDRSSPLYGCRLVLFAHDEFVLSCAVDRADIASKELSRLMIAGMAKVISDVRIEAECVIMTRWGKG